MAGLTEKRVARLIRAGEVGRYLDDGRDAVRGLYLTVKNRNNASWLLRYQLDHKPRYMGLGSARDFDLAQARERAKAAREKLADKTDPLDHRRTQRAAEKRELFARLAEHQKAIAAEIARIMADETKPT